MKSSVKTIQHCWDLEIWSRSLTVLWTGKAQWVVWSCKIHSYHIYGVRENPNVKVFYKSRHLTNQKHVNDLPLIHISHTKCIVNIYGNHITVKIQMTRSQNTQFAVYNFDTPVTFKQKQGHHPKMMK